MKANIMTGVPLRFYKKKEVKSNVDIKNIKIVNKNEAFQIIKEIPHIFSIRFMKDDIDTTLLVRNITEIFNHKNKSVIELRNITYEQANKKRDDVSIEIKDIIAFIYNGETYVVDKNEAVESFSSVSKLKKNIIN